MSSDIDTLLLQYSAGTLDTPMSILVASYLTLEPEARKKLGFADNLNASSILVLSSGHLLRTCLKSCL